MPPLSAVRRAQRACHELPRAGRLRTSDIPIGPRDLAVRSIEAADHDAILALYARVARDQNGYLDRGPYIWDRVRSPRAEPARGYLVESDDGLEGYLYISQRRTEHGHYDLAVVDLCSTNAHAGRCLLGVVAEHRTLGDTTAFACGAADPVLSLLPERYQCELGDGNGTLRAGPRGLAALYSGFMSPTALSRAGLLDGDERALATAAGVFAGPAPCMRDHF